MMTDPDYYKILSVPVDASLEAIRQSYYKLAKQFHPDKNRHRCYPVSPGGPEDRSATLLDPCTSKTENFVLIHEAFRILSDPVLRKEFDDRRRALHKSLTITAEIGVDEMDVVHDPDGLSFPCRCGDVYFVPKEKPISQEAIDLVIPCSSCSFAILLHMEGA